MNIDKSIRFLRRVKWLEWHKGQLFYCDPDQHDNNKIVEYQDRWTKSPTRDRIWLNGSGSHTTYNNAHLPW